MNRERSSGRRGRTRLVVLLAFGAACGDGTPTGTPDPPDPPDPPAVQAVEVSSQIDTLLAVGWTTPFQAIARDGDGNTISASFTWLSSNPDVASVGTSGSVTANAAGTAEISATADDVTGSVRIAVIPAQVQPAAALFEDPLLDHLVAGMGTAGGPAASALAACDGALEAGNLVAAGGCLGTLRAAAADATDPDDRVLMAVLLLMADHAARLLTL